MSVAFDSDVNITVEMAFDSSPFDSSQSFTDFDIIISDQSKNSDIKNSIKTYKNLDIKYLIININ